MLGFGTFSTSSSPDAYMGMTFNVVPDWWYAVSSVLGFICAALFAVAAVELMHVMEEKYKLMEGLDSGAESFGWLTLYLVCALSLVGKEEKV